MGFLLAVLAAQSVGSMRRLSATSDETSHLPSGYTYLRTGDLRLNPQHPPLVKELCALPLLALEPRLDLEDPNWRHYPDEWRFGFRFLYSNDAARLLFWGRLPVVVLTLLLGLALFGWAREMFGAPAGWMALVLFVFSPNVIAHSHLVTMDLALACFSFVTIHRLWRFLRHGRWRELVLAGLALGLALATKFSALILVPVVAALLMVAAVGPWKRAGSSRLVGALGAMLGLAVLVVWAAYQFPADPWFYMDGLREVNADHNPDYAYYLAGEFRKGGFPWYFLVAFLVKTPLPTLAVLALAIVRVRRYPAGDLVDEAFLALPVIAFVAATSLLADNLGLRYLLPIFPFLFLFASRVATVILRATPGKVVAVALAAWYVGAAVFIYPNHLAYFNEVAGGPGRGHHWLDDSNVDWGEGLVQLAEWVEREQVEVVRLNYGWNASPAYYGIPFEPVSVSQWTAERPPPGTYAVSTHLLVRGEYHHRRRGVPTDWLSRYDPVDRVGYAFYIFHFD